MIEWEKISPRLGDWAPNFYKFWERGGFDEIYKKLKEQSKLNTVVPKSEDLFKAFELCPKSKLSVIFLGMDPYPSIKDGVIVADGLAFSCSHTGIIQPSLEKIWEALEDDLYNGLHLKDMPFANLTPWAREGILLLNSSLTTSEGVSGKHKDIWEPFMTYFFKEVMAGISGIPIVFMGRQAEEYMDLVDTSMNYIKYVEHPVAASYGKRKWNHDNLFSWVGKILKGNNNLEINYYDVPF